MRCTADSGCDGPYKQGLYTQGQFPTFSMFFSHENPISNT